MNDTTTAQAGNTSDTERTTLEQHWEEQVQIWSNSGLSKSAFCKRTGINYHQMIYWSKKLARSNAPPSKNRDSASGNTAKASGFVAVSVVTPPSAGLFLRLPGGIEIGGIEEPRLAHIINLVSR